jgi:hypothetical protein
MTCPPSALPVCATPPAPRRPSHSAMHARTTPALPLRTRHVTTVPPPPLPATRCPHPPRHARHIPSPPRHPTVSLHPLPRRHAHTPLHLTPVWIVLPCRRSTLASFALCLPCTLALHSVPPPLPCLRHPPHLCILRASMSAPVPRLVNR